MRIRTDVTLVWRVTRCFSVALGRGGRRRGRGRRQWRRVRGRGRRRGRRLQQQVIAATGHSAKVRVREVWRRGWRTRGIDGVVVGHAAVFARVTIVIERRV